MIISAVHAFGQLPQQYLFSHLGTRDGLASDQVMNVEQDQKGYLWIATLNGLQRYDGHRFLTFRHKQGNPATLPNDEVYSVRMDKNRLWVLCGENHIGYFNGSNFAFREVPVRLSKSSIKNSGAKLYIDYSGNIMLVFSGITWVTFNENSGEFAEKYNPFELPANWHPISVLHDARQRIYWIACDSGLAEFNALRKTMSYRGHNVDNDTIINGFRDLNTCLFLSKTVPVRSGSIHGCRGIRHIF